MCVRESGKRPPSRQRVYQSWLLAAGDGCVGLTFDEVALPGPARSAALPLPTTLTNCHLYICVRAATPRFPAPLVFVCGRAAGARQMQITPPPELARRGHAESLGVLINLGAGAWRGAPRCCPADPSLAPTALTALTGTPTRAALSLRVGNTARGLWGACLCVPHEWHSQSRYRGSSEDSTVAVLVVCVDVLRQRLVLHSATW